MTIITNLDIMLAKRKIRSKELADAIGITVCLFAFSHRSFQYPSSRFAQHYHLLREFACFHPEAELINAAID